MATNSSQGVPVPAAGGAADAPIGGSIASTGMLSLSQKLAGSLSRLRRGGKGSIAGSSRAEQLRKDIDFTGGVQPGGASLSLESSGTILPGFSGTLVAPGVFPACIVPLLAFGALPMRTLSHCRHVSILSALHRWVQYLQCLAVPRTFVEHLPAPHL